MDFNEVKKDIELCESALKDSKEKQKDVFNLLTGKYHSLPLSDLQTNRLFLRSHSDEYRNNLIVIMGYLQTCLRENNTNSMSSDEIERPYSKVFVVHGHDEAMKQSVARLIEKQGIEAIILQEQPNQGATIIEKIEENSDVDAAICLFNSDDVGRLKSSADERQRARQNVVFETGYFIGKYGRKHVVIIAEQGIELPSDMQGIVYTNSKSWETDVLKDLKTIGYNIDFNLAF